MRNVFAGAIVALTALAFSSMAIGQTAQPKQANDPVRSWEYDPADRANGDGGPAPQARSEWFLGRPSLRGRGRI